MSSRLYSAIAAGCIPVVVSNRLAGAFESHVPYGEFTLRVDERAFARDPHGLLGRLRALGTARVAELQAGLRRHVADLTYDSIGSRVGSNLLRAAHEGCVLGSPSAVLGLHPGSHRYGAEGRQWGVGCSCRRQPPAFWWADDDAARDRPRRWRRGSVPTEVCRCTHCATMCAGEGGGAGGTGGARSGS